jgi:hypothetical protein
MITAVLPALATRLNQPEALCPASNEFRARCAQNTAKNELISIIICISVPRTCIGQKYFVDQNAG